MTSLMNKIELLIKREKTTPERKKNDDSTKSSSEILSELFGAFNADPPKIDEVSVKKNKKSKKKHKKDKKKRSRSSSSSKSDSDDSEYTRKRKKRKKSKSKKRRDRSRSRSPAIKIDSKLVNIKYESKESKHKDVKIKKEHVKVEPKEEKPVSIKIEDIELPLDASSIPLPASPKEKLSEDDLRLKLDSKQHDTNSETDKSKGKIQIKNLKFSTVFEETVKKAEEEARRRAEKYEDGEYTDSSSSSVKEEDSNSQFPKSADPGGILKKQADKEKQVEEEKTARKTKHAESVQKLTTKAKSKSPKRSSSKSKKRSRSRSASRRHHRSSSKSRRRSRSRHRSHSRSKRRSRSRSKHRSRHHSPSRHRSRRSRSPTGVKLADSEKKRLLEVARRNAINMLKNGLVPAGAAALPPHTRNQVMAAIQSGGSSGMRVLTRHDLITIMERSNASNFNEKLEFMELELLHQYSEDDPNIADAKHKLSIIRHQFKQKWSAARNTNARFLETNKEWLKGTISLPKAGKSVDELTDFCKHLSKKEALGELSSVSSNDEDMSENEDTMAFHHPFLVKEKAPIVMNIRGGAPLPTKSSSLPSVNKEELRLQFPVSSGTQHREKAIEWVPVSPKKDSSETQVAKLGASASTKAVPKVIAAVEPPPEITSKIPEPLPLPAPPPVEPPAYMKSFTSGTQLISVPALPAPGPQAYPPDVVDVGSIVSQKLMMIRMEQEENELSNSFMHGFGWSKDPSLGQFTGSTGAQILTPRELASGTQAWVKKDQLVRAAPVEGGMGMHLLQKMGWTPGQGLGKEGTGTLQPLLLEVKLDTRGLQAKEEAPNRHNKIMKIQRPGRRGPAPLVAGGKHPVSLLGEYCSKKKLGPPEYNLCFECGPDHKKNFLFRVKVANTEYQPAVASANKKQAKADAAQLALQKLGIVIV